MLDNWEEELITRGKNFQFSVDTAVDLIDKDMEPYWDYFVKQGDDGVFSREIYLYYQKLSDLQRIILSWRPEHDLYYYFSFKLDHPLLDTTYISGEEFVTFLNHIQAFELRDLLADHVQPYDEMAFYFEKEKDVEKVRSVTIPTNSKDEIRNHRNSFLVFLLCKTKIRSLCQTQSP